MFKVMNKFFKQKNKTNNGFSLVETLVAISIFSLSILGLMSVLASGISNTNYAKQKIVASYLAQEGIEYVRNMRDNAVLYPSGTGWTNFSSPGTINYPAVDDFASFNREITKIAVPASSDELQITSKVSWTQGSGNYNITLTENLFNWY